MTVLDLAEREARKRSETLEALGKLQSGFTATRYPLTPGEQHELRRLKAAAAAATTVDVFVALACGEAVPVHRLNKRLVERHYQRVHRGG